MLSVLALPACGKSEGETCDEEQEENDRHHNHQHLGEEDDDDDDGNDDDDDDDDDGDAGDHQHLGEGLENDDGGGAGHQRSQHMCLLSPGKGLEQGANSRSLLGHRSRGSQLPGPPVLHLMICYDHSLI